MLVSVCMENGNVVVTYEDGKRISFSYDEAPAVVWEWLAKTFGWEE